MSEVVVAAGLAAAASVICQIITSKTAAKKDSIERAKRQQKLDDDINTLTKRVNEHNNYAALFAQQTAVLSDLSTDIKLMKQDIKYIKEGRFNGTAN